MKKSIILKSLSLIIASTLIFSGCTQKAENTSANSNSTNSNEATAQQTELLSGKHMVNIIIKDKGTITVELDADVAPISATNFINLAKQGFYDGVMDTLIYHWNGEAVVEYRGTDVMLAAEKNVEVVSVNSMGAEYLPEENIIHAWHWDESKQSFAYGKYDIDLEKIQQWLEEEVKS